MSSRLRVSLDTNPLYTGRAGVARYVNGLLAGYERLADPKLSLLPVAWKVTNFAYRQPTRALKTAYRELWWARWVAPAQLRRMQVQLHHSTGSPLFTPPSPIAHVVTLCDLAVICHPERYRRWQRFADRKRFARLHQAHRVICISQFTADEAIRLLALPANKLEVIHLGCAFSDAEFQPEESPPDARLPGEYFLFVGSLEPGKNLRLLRQAYLHAQDKRAPLPPLVVVGARWEGVDREGRAPSNWHYLGRIPDSQLVHLYRRALGLVFPSIYEGFGFPVLEAQSLGCPVICSRVASLPEVGGDAALYAELDAAAYADAMERLHANAKLRAELIESGLQNARRFTWRRCAEQTVAIYRQVCG